ncbi:hypothetical protein C7H19_01575 [Aphanothece hegewaldii CCALA 016]|uniref:Uncharacterized protein n=1 Tax=Aphanothece hegewaldii CCALA 016 TaxID=2107694 RepID=A0A2T1M3U7_9CHRO|nr:hypothetical protein [Aphanothece hegewaldii]PSF39505.1 hypothetical protein C7H19_01575 [Aphanothece hegewaldii CCALA 016]
MSREIGSTLKLVLFSAISATLLQAFPVEARPNSRPQMRSRPILSNLESRSFSENPEAFFPNSGQDIITYPEGTVGSRSQSESDFEFLGQNFEVKMGETTHADPEFDTFSRNEAQTDKIRVNVNVLEWNN